ncbi:hypothetical protein [Nocardia sp. CA-290969]|uniref:hypothetical protein n=1 Tax=Nocardia sp. CA-290969 TaxID=3239986 RepID=UPI003D8C37E3
MKASLLPEHLIIGTAGSIKLEFEQSDQSGYYWFMVEGQIVSFVEDEREDVFRYHLTSDRRAKVTYISVVAEDVGDVIIRWFRAGGSGLDDARATDILNAGDEIIGSTVNTATIGNVVENPYTRPIPVSLEPSRRPQTEDELLWAFVDKVGLRMRFEKFCEFVHPQLKVQGGHHLGHDAYSSLKSLADQFVAHAALPKSAMEADSDLADGVFRDVLTGSYVEGIKHPSKWYLGERPYGHELVNGEDLDELERAYPLINVPFVELIWNYWMEEAMLVQTMNRIVARFQNRRSDPVGDPLLRLNVNPLMSLRAFLWPFAEDEKNRLTVRRRAAEYEYEYGLRLRGRAIPHASTLSERRSQFLEAFHRLLHTCSGFFKEFDDKTVDADAFPLLSNLQEVHLILARGAHNQFAALAPAARAEMLTIQWMLAQPEMHEFLGGPTMMPYEEEWMDRVDTMKTLQHWSDTSVTHFFELAVHGEQLLLSIRHGRWNDSKRTREHAKSWALNFRNPIQRYIGALETVVGIDLKTAVDATMLSDLLQRRLDDQRTRA